MRVSESVQWIVIYYRTFAQTALTESFELKSETVDLFIVFQGNFNQASPVGSLSARLRHQKATWLQEVPSLLL